MKRFGRKKRVMPQYLLLRDEALAAGFVPRCKITLMDIGSATNARTMFATILDGVPCGNSATILDSGHRPPLGAALLLAHLNSFVFDWQLRQRLGGLHLTWHYLEETALYPPQWGMAMEGATTTALKLACNASQFSPMWLAHLGRHRTPHWALKARWALTESERLRLRCSLDAMSALMVGLEFEDLKWLLSDCDLPSAQLTRESARTLDPKGFWRADKEKDPELRHTILTLIAFHDLQALVGAHLGDRGKGIKAFFAQNDGEGWMLPEAIRLSDYDLGRDNRAHHPQPVRDRLGPRFFDFQVEQSVEDSWKECRLHARNLLGEAGYAALERELAGGGRVAEPVRKVAEPSSKPNGKPGQPELFDE
ncbi:MAG: hypothetical protein IPJ95_05990 [Gemmatimonadetes bacterium]|nr:hypothetical protein [Gemmatimonadota bacterium]